MPGSNRSLTIDATISSLGAITKFVRTGALEAGLPNARINELDLLLEEAVVNVCSHAYPEGARGCVTVTYSISAPGELRVEIADQGVEFNPLAAETPDLTLNIERRPVGGLGILLLKTLATSLTYRRENGWNRLTFGVAAGC